MFSSAVGLLTDTGCVVSPLIKGLQFTLPNNDTKLKLERSNITQLQLVNVGTATPLSTTELGNVSTFFIRRVACEPYCTTALTSFLRLLSSPSNVLKLVANMLALDNWKPTTEQEKGLISDGTLFPLILLSLVGRNSL